MVFFQLCLAPVREALCIGTASLAGHSCEHIENKMEAIEVIHHRHVKRRCGRALFLVSAHVEIRVIGSPVCQPVDQPGIAVEREHYRLVGGEKKVERVVAEPVWMLALRLQRHEIDDIDEADAKCRKSLPQNCRGGKRLQRWHVTGTSDNNIRLSAFPGTRPFPYAESRFAVRGGRVDVEPLRRGLLAC